MGCGVVRLNVQKWSERSLFSNMFHIFVSICVSWRHPEDLNVQCVVFGPVHVHMLFVEVTPDTMPCVRRV